MMQVLFDTNIVLDALLKRAPWEADAAACWKACDEGRIMGCLTASTLTDIFYISRKLKGTNVARDAVRICLDAFAICIVDRQALELAIDLPADDFEDNLQSSAPHSLDWMLSSLATKTAFKALQSQFSRQPICWRNSI